MHVHHHKILTSLPGLAPFTQFVNFVTVPAKNKSSWTNSFQIGLFPRTGTITLWYDRIKTKYPVVIGIVDGPEATNPSDARPITQAGACISTE